MSILLLYVIFQIADKFLGNYPRRVKLLSILEIWISYILVKIGVSRQPIVTPDIILTYVCWCFVIKLALKTITMIFKISTRNFGYFMETNPTNVSLNNN